MMPRAARFLGMLGPLAVAIALLATPAQAQEFKLGDYTISGDLEMGVRQLQGERKSSRFNEFRDIPQGLFFPDLRLDINKPGYYYELRAQELLENDQDLRFSLGAPGLYRLDVEWYEIQHMFYNQARTPYSGVGGDKLTIDDFTRTSLQGSAAAALTTNLDTFFQGGHREVIGFGRDRAEVKFRYLLGPDWMVKLAYKNERWDGTRPMSGLFGSSPGGRPVIQLPQPVDYRHDDVRFALEWARAGHSLELAYQASIFQNKFSSLTFHNPLRLNQTSVSSANSSTPAQGRFALDPDNQAHYLTLSGAVNLPAETRFMGTFSYGWMLQDEDFLPHSINSQFYNSITGPSLALPRQSLDGEINPTLVNLVLTNRAIPNLTVTGRYRYYDLANNSKRIEFPGHTVGDTLVVTTAEETRLLEFTRQNAGVDLSYRLTKDLKLNGGYEWRKTDYHEFHAKENQEDRAKVSLDIKANNWLMIRPAYIFSDRDVSGYQTQTPPGQAERRMFNLAERERHEGKLMARIMPSDKFSISFEGGIGTEDYKAKYGLDKSDVWNVSVEVAVTPVDWLNLFAAYSHEQIYGKIHSVQNSRVGNTDTFFDGDAWTMKFTDDYDVIRGGVDLLLYENKSRERKVTLRTELTYAYSVGETKNAWDQGTPANITGASAITRDWPDIKARLWMVSTRLDYQLSKNFTIGVGYSYERYDLDDFTQQFVSDVVVDPTVTTQLYTFGDALRNYEAHTVAAFVRWRF